MTRCERSVAWLVRLDILKERLARLESIFVWIAAISLLDMATDLRLYEVPLILALALYGAVTAVIQKRGVAQIGETADYAEPGEAAE